MCLARITVAIRAYTIVTIVGIMSAAADAPADRQDPRESIRHDLNVLAETDVVLEFELPESFGEAYSRLKEGPRGIVIDEVIDRLRHDDDFQAGAAKLWAYRLLKQHRAAATEHGFEQLLEGVDDPDVRAISLSALGTTPDRWHPRLAEVIGPLLGDDESGRSRIRVLQLLARSGEHAAEHLPAIERLYHDEDIEPIVRVNAAIAVPPIAGIAYAIDMFDLEDDGIADRPAVEAEAIVTAISQFGAQTRGTFDVEPDERAAPRAMAREAMTHEDAEVRRQAAWAMLTSYSEEEVVVEDEDGEFIIAPALREPFEMMAERDPEPELRAVAQQVLDTRFQRAIRHHEQPR